MTVLVLTERFDPSADLVVDELSRREVPVFRCDTGQFPNDLSVRAEIATSHSGDAKPGWVGELLITVGGRMLSLHEVTSAYYRRPSTFPLATGLSPGEQDWCAQQAKFGLGGLLGTLPHWLNHPHRIAQAEYKPTQLAAASAAGLKLPRTLLTNDPLAAAQFAHDVGGIVYKPLSPSGINDSSQPTTVYTTKLTATDLPDPGVAATMHMFQQWIDKAYEVRLTVVDNRFFAARIDADSAEAHIDWRRDYGALRYSIIDPPSRVLEQVSALLAYLDLRFAAIDFAVTPQGDWIFFEINPNGQWAWIEQKTGLSICAAIADALTNYAR